MQQAAGKRAEAVWGLVLARLHVAMRLVKDDEVLETSIGAVMLLVEEEMKRGSAKRYAKGVESAEQPRYQPSEGYQLVLERDGSGQLGSGGFAGDERASVPAGDGREEGSDGDEGPRGDDSVDAGDNDVDRPTGDLVRGDHSGSRESADDGPRSGAG